MPIYNAGSGLAGLGIVAYPNEVNRSLTGFQGGGLGSAIAHGQGLGAPISHTYGLGNVPNDIDLARHRDTWYQGVHHGWIRNKDRFYNDGNLGTPISHTYGLGNTTNAVRGILGLDPGDKALEEIARSEKIKAGMAIISAVAVSTVALITVVGFVKGR
ncbi:MAG: hypothetical protein JSV86_10625 [Gemmatimonadota bacterium]|nr:MAG: hypothetical protein JSV86_10625 [Gemmatimonadota bacterium]